MISERFRERIAALMEPGFNTIEQVEGLLAEGEILAWYGRDSALIGYTEEFDAGARALRIVWGVGDLDEIRNEMRPMLEAWARQNGCQWLLAQGREGWVRALRNDGFELDHILVRKEL